uniref:probable protein-export membrane protein SecG n=1 Tax=Polyopes affinis TaxID=194519 RepID=UPI002A83ED2D|nr:probable protein-export membrane protein SecG [Polyopes affinis]WOL37085.1 probable protein-export membrane protein SecG [Polyopes affinis]
MKLIWYINIIFTIFLILVNSPKTTSLGDFGNQKQVLNITRGTQKKIQIITILNIFIFFIFTVFFVLYFPI